MEQQILRPCERLRSIVMSMSVCLSVCPRAYLRSHTRDLYQIFVHVAYVRGSVVLRQGNEMLEAVLVIFFRIDNAF